MALNSVQLNSPYGGKKRKIAFLKAEKMLWWFYSHKTKKY
jgi:hypothetical protein